MKVGAVFVTYNPNKLFWNNVNKIIKHVQLCIVYDNSEKNDLIIPNTIAGNIEIHRSGQNDGISVALNYSFKIFDLNGFNYVLTYDQDSIIETDNLPELFNILKDNPEYAISSPFVLNKFITKKPIPGLIEIRPTVIMSGNCVKVDLWKKVGGFEEKYFIDYVDIDFCLKVHLYGYKIVCLHDVILFHEEGTITERKIINKKYYPLNHSSVRYYYKSRNIVLLSNKFLNKLPLQIKHEIYYYLKNIIKMILFETNKKEKIKYIFQGFSDSLKGKYGPYSK